jgi:hypothetical protein
MDERLREKQLQYVMNTLTGKDETEEETANSSTPQIEEIHYYEWEHLEKGKGIWNARLTRRCLN